ncbi:unnamed protein product [Rotaria magnacalcarata]|uniref:TTF-type domain-containing protein n=3 Tax=Rotaria magnacalcarata TaxID=392030 RepID=A0A815JTB5_9BILA|nr:unnamed protein product [Rotaria magnacalcarata]
MPAKQSQIASFFQSKKRKTSNSADKNSSPADILSNSSNENEARPESYRETSSSELPNVSTSVSSTTVSLSPTSILLTTVSSNTVSPTSISPLSISSTAVSPTSISSATVSPTLISPLSISSTAVSPTSISPSSIASTVTSSTTVSPASDSSTIKLQCELECCMSDHQFVPKIQSDLKPSTDKRSCQLGWFLVFKWLSYCKSENKAYCYYCRKAYLCGFHPESNKIGETALTCTGYSDWKNALARFSKHEFGRVHADCVYRVNEQQKPTVAARLSLTHQIQQENRRRMLFTEVECIKFLLRQGLALRGHVEDEGNLIQLLKLRETDVDGLSSWIKYGNYLSHDIINEICQIISLSIVRDLLKQICERKFYSIICDETRDESGTEQLCFTIRSVDSDFVVHEDVLGMYGVTSQSAEHITNIILDILIRCNLDIKYCRGQGYDGAAAMAGHVSGVSTRITSLCKKAFYIHCNAHSLDLALQDLTRTSSSVSIALNMTNDIVNFMRESPKRLNLLDTLSGLDSYTKLKPLCPTRWTVRSSSLNVLLINYALVKNALTEINLEGGRVAPKANVEQFILSTANGTQDCDDAINIIDIDEFLTDDINVDRLNLELMMLPDYFSSINKEKKLGLKKITKISTVCELLNAQQLGKTMFYEYCKLITLYLTVPVTTATAERSFSVLNRIKTYLRCTMSQQRLNHVIIPHIHKDKLDLLDLNSVCSDFISKNENRKTFFGAV